MRQRCRGTPRQTIPGKLRSPRTSSRCLTEVGRAEFSVIVKGICSDNTALQGMQKKRL